MAERRNTETREGCRVGSVATISARTLLTIIV